MLHLRLERCSSPIGELMVVTDDEGALRTIEFEDDDARLHKSLRAQYHEYALEAANERSPVAKALDAYFAGDVRAIDTLPVVTAGTDFQREVWAALRTIPTGATMTYSAIATAIGRPNATRAVGLANGSNPIPIVVPCHRVIGADGTLTGYGGGLARKRWLLQHESDHTGPKALTLF